MKFLVVAAEGGEDSSDKQEQIQNKERDTGKKESKKRNLAAECTQYKKKIVSKDLFLSVLNYIHPFDDYQYIYINIFVSLLHFIVHHNCDSQQQQFIDLIYP